MAKWNLDTIEADMAEIRESVDKLQEINRLQAQTIERQADNYASLARQLADRDEQLRRAQERIRAAEETASRALDDAAETYAHLMQAARDNARDAALEEAALSFVRADGKASLWTNDAVQIAIRSLKSTQGSRK